MSLVMGVHTVFLPLQTLCSWLGEINVQESSSKRRRDPEMIKSLEVSDQQLRACETVSSYSSGEGSGFSAHQPVPFWSPMYSRQGQSSIGNVRRERRRGRGRDRIQNIYKVVAQLDIDSGLDHHVFHPCCISWCAPLSMGPYSQEHSFPKSLFQIGE